MKFVKILCSFAIVIGLLTGCNKTINKPAELVNIDYTKSANEILNNYTDEAQSTLKSIYIEPSTLEVALKNLGKTAYNIKGKTFDRKNFKLSDYKDKKVVLDIVRVDCPTCQASIKVIDNIIKNNPDITVITIFYRDGKENISKYYTNKSSNTNKLIVTNEGFDAKNLILEFNLTHVPTLIFIDESQRISFIHEGEITESDFTIYKKYAFNEKIYTKLKTKQGK